MTTVPAYRPPPVTGRAEARIWSLVMRTRPARPPTVPPLGTDIVRAERITASFYRYLYDTVGGPWCWTARRLIDDDELLRRVRDPGVEIDVLWAGGVPAGYVEFAADEMPAIWIAYFGLVPEFIGRRLGGRFLDWAVDRAWELGAGEVRVQTCSLDHEAALPNYERAGFELESARIEHVDVIEGVAVRPRSGA
ncbi:MAG TPA: GNAT family N-acetyltransferase [Geminicoccaceae bacterium]|nr:GNAT family N-acetyltransferase [Geminicoccus sp.]HMU49074.1 GNAT family N-acetyltransferase [Geminicoccaceae bacterium]